ncbi:hypothetical protein [Metabacillus iocasae]|uniref:CopG family transcriptional regulator n=1 Tax=Priestia iocasae TaxID=2291674 RepID=A0ABS2QXS4_9BACI|nr:hypothetical protein [Metabacillus iocasae]MBM7703531.1 hypothetical protein [Metabacillus iocasae]
MKNIQLTAKGEAIPIHLYLPQSLHDEINQMALELGLTKNAIVTMILLSFLEQYEEHMNNVFSVMKQPSGANHSRLQVRIPSMIKYELEAAAQEQKQPVNWLVNLALQTFLDNYITSGRKLFFDLLDEKYR